MRTPKIRDEKDEFVTSRKGTAITFPKFYSNLFAKEEHDDDEGIDEEERTNSHLLAGANEEQEKEKIENSEEVDENENLKDRSEHILEFTNKNCKQPSTAPKKGKI